MSLPHIKNSKAGINRQEPLFKQLFEVYFSIPEALVSEIGAEDVNVLTEQVKSVGGLDTLTKSPGIVEQTYMGATRSYLGSGLDGTAHDVSITIQLNLRNATDNYIFKLFKKWNKLGYNMETGERSIKDEYVADFLRVVQFNKRGDIYRDITYHDIMLMEVSGLDSAEYGDPTGIHELNIKFRSDWADDVDA